MPSTYQGHALLRLCLVAVLALMIGGIIYILSIKKKIENNFEPYRCNLLVLMLVGLKIINPSSKLSASEIIKDCYLSIGDEIISAATDGVRQQAGQLMNGLESTYQSLSKDSIFNTNMWNTFGNFFQAFMDRFSNVGSAVQLAAIKIRSILNRLIGSVTTIYYLIISIVSFILWVKNIPYMIVITIICTLLILAPILLFLASPASIMLPMAFGVLATEATAISGCYFLCFDGDTIIELPKGQTRMIKDIQVGDRLIGGGTVQGKLVFSSRGAPMFQYPTDQGGILVSGGHGVFDPAAGKWIRVSECPKAKRVSYPSENIIYCLTTSNQRIPIHNQLFLDYTEIKDPDFFTQMDRYLVFKLNNYRVPTNILSPSTFALDASEPVLGGETDIEMLDSFPKKIKDIQLGERTRRGLVVGKISISTSQVTIYRYHTPTGSLLMSGTQLVKEWDGTETYWVRAYQSKSAERLRESPENDGRMYQLIVDHSLHELCHQKLILKDFSEMTTPSDLDIIDQQVLHNLNSTKEISVSLGNSLNGNL